MKRQALHTRPQAQSWLPRLLAAVAVCWLQFWAYGYVPTCAGSGLCLSLPRHRPAPAGSPSGACVHRLHPGLGDRGSASVGREEGGGCTSRCMLSSVNSQVPLHPCSRQHWLAGGRAGEGEG